MKEKILKLISKPTYTLFGITILFAAIAGSAYAYFQLTASNSNISGNAAGDAGLNLVVTDISTGATGKLIPIDNTLSVLNKAALGHGNSSGTYNASKQCKDKNGYSVCKVYQIDLTNTGTSPLTVTGGVTELSGTNMPNISCTLMSDNHTVSAVTNCIGNNTLANKVIMNGGATNTYYVMVFINNLAASQTDAGTFNGTVEFNTGSGGQKARFKDSADEKITKLFTKTGTVTESSSSTAVVLDVDTTHSLVKDPSGNIRYYGANPNNYIYFNCTTYPSTGCETWRIIGVVDGKLKLIRGSTLGTYSWDTAANNTAGNSGEGINEWSQADLMKLLNPGYNSLSVGGSLYYNSGSGTCYSGKSNATKSCNFSSTGIKNDATRNKIADAIYYTGGWNTITIFPNVMMTKERGTIVGSNTNDHVTRTTTWTGKIALPYPSDYGYATDLSLCVNKNISVYNDTNCVNNDWMHKIITNNGATNGRFITPRSEYGAYVWYLSKTGEVKQSGNAYYAGTVAPALYLSPYEIIESGEGTSGNPYKLSA